MASTNVDNQDCPNCNKSGLAILPVRYALVPKKIEATLPTSLGAKVTDVKLAHHKYALRTLRQGFFYLFYEKHARGSHIKWEAYSVSAAGTLWKQLSTSALNGISAEPSCSRKGHNIPASVIAIEQPEKCGRIWLAFSEHAWSAETFDLFQNDAHARGRRMQEFNPSKWVTTSVAAHSLEATEANIGQILEYKDKAGLTALLPSAVVPTLSKPDGSFDPAKLEKQTTRYPYHNREAQTEELVKLMKKVGENATGKAHTPVIFTLWDAVGITHELAGFCHDLLGWLDKYSHERELELGAMNAIEGLKKALPEKEIAFDEHLRGGHESERERRGNLNAMRRVDAERAPAASRSRKLEVCDIVEDWTSKNLFHDEFEKRLMQANMLPEPARSAQIKKIRAQADQYLTNRDKGNSDRLEERRAHAWDKYQEKIDKERYDYFQQQQQQLAAASEVILHNRTEDMVAWLESSSLVDALTEFHPENIEDGIAFNEVVGEAIFGMNASQRGGIKLDEWIREKKASEKNLLWRAVALNQKQPMAELDAELAEATKHQTERTMASAINWTNYTSKSLKALADTYKKTVSFHNANTSASSAKGSSAFGIPLRPVKMHGIDKLVVTAGDRFFKAFSVPGLADHACEKIIQQIFSIRAFVNPMDSAKLIQAQAANDGIVRSQQLARLRTARTFLAADTPSIRTAQSEALADAWNDFKTKNSGAASAMKDARLALLVMLIEGVNFNKLIADCAMKKDAKSWWSLVASGITITSGMFEVASVPAKVLFGNAEAWSYQRIKLAGGLLGSTASMIGAVLDIRDAAKFYGKGNSAIALVYGLKAAAGITNAGLTIAATFSYAAPLIGRLTGNTALSTAARVVGARAAAVIGFRILIMSAGAWLTILAFGIQIFIWIMSDDALEEWCSLCAFGINRDSRDAYRTFKAQIEQLEKAQSEIGLQETKA
jgi:hypothetical protein